MTTPTIYGTQVTQYYLDRQSAFAAGGTPINIAGGSVLIGDGNGSVPTISQLIANGGVLHALSGTGVSITSVVQDVTTPAQIDIGVLVPATVAGVETGPFTIREFAIYDATGNLCAVGVTNLEKSTGSGQNQVADIAWSACIATAVAGSVAVTPAAVGYATMPQVQSFFNANLPTVAAPLTQNDTESAGLVIERVFGLRAASQPADPVTTGEDAAATGYGRPASAAEFSNGAPFGAGYAFPWPTLQQVKAALAPVNLRGAAFVTIHYTITTGGTYVFTAQTEISGSIESIVFTPPTDVGVGAGDNVWQGAFAVNFSEPQPNPYYYVLPAAGAAPPGVTQPGVESATTTGFTLLWNFKMDWPLGLQFTLIPFV